MIVTGEYVYNNIELNETYSIVENTLEEKYGYNYRGVVEVMCFAEFLDKIKNETKNTIINS